MIYDEIGLCALGPMVDAIGFGMVNVDHLTRKKIFTLTSSNNWHFNSNFGKVKGNLSS